MIGMTAAEKLSVALGSPMVEFALDYARRGWPVFPCRPTNKTPYIKGGHNSATTDPETIRQWWTEYPRAMIGVPMGSRSGVWAIDPDPPKKDGEPDGRVLWAELVEKHGKVPPTHKEVTPRGGRHILFAWDPQRPVTDSPGALKGQNIDVRGEGGYVIVAPSISVGDGGKNVAGEYCVVEPLVFFSLRRRRTGFTRWCCSQSRKPHRQPWFLSTSATPSAKAVVCLRRTSSGARSTALLSTCSGRG